MSLDYKIKTVKTDKYEMDYADLKYWYDGYRLANEQIYNPFLPRYEHLNYRNKF